MISRRQFLVIAGVAAAMPHSLWAFDDTPTMLDHLLLGCNDLDQGIAFVGQHTGVRPALGGAHPGRGTRNALLGLGVPRYLEVIAPDPQQSDIEPAGVAMVNRLRQLTAPQLIGWAVHTLTIEAVAEQLRQAGIAFRGPTPGSRTRLDGEVLHWKTLNLNDDRGGLLPFFIQWGQYTTQPSVDAPTGCLLDSFEVVSPDSAVLSAEFQQLGIDVEVQNGNTAHLRARIEGPKGTLSLGD